MNVLHSFIPICVIFFLVSCETGQNMDYDLVESPDYIAQEALEYAYQYSQEDTTYEYGGQDPLRAIKIDCSGLIVNCYNYAVQGTEYFLLFSDAAVINFYKEWTNKTDTPRPGDLIFMGDSTTPTHMAVFVKRENGNIYFIDANYKPEDNIDGVSERHYPEDDSRFISFGVLLLGMR